MSKEVLSLMKQMGIPAEELLGELKELVKQHTVTTGEGGKPLSKPIPPTPRELEAMASKLITATHLAGVEPWVEKQLVALL